jgi:hypothetical protein
MPTLFEVKLKSIKVNENGFIEEKGLNLFEASLIYPKDAVPLVQAVTTLNLKDGEEYDIAAEYNKAIGSCLQEGGLKKELLFKQVIQDTSLLEINLGAKEKANEVEKILSKLLGVGAVAAIGTISGVGAVITAVAGSATGSLFSQLEPKDDIKNIGKGFFLIDKDTRDGVYSIDLYVPEKIKITKGTYNRTRDRWDVEKKELAKCYKNGFAKVSIKRI